MQWIQPTRNDGRERHIAQAFGISPVTAALLANRGFTDSGRIEAFLSPRLQGLSDPLLPGNMQRGVERLEQAMQRQESILIFGDYDVDGVTSTVFLIQFLRIFGLSPRFIVPRRLKEGYGLSLDSLERALADGRPDLLIAVDCGTGSAQEVAWLRQKGIDVLILDHHASKEGLPEGAILINPHVHDGKDVPWKHLCAVGLVFKFCHAFLKMMREKGDPLAEQTDLKEFLDLVALGTVADLVLLEGENRILVKHGLQRLRRCRRPGICALMEVAGITLGEEITPFDIGFKLGPRINASGRLDDASGPIELLLSEDWNTCHEAARLLDSFNRERQDIEKAITLKAEGLVSQLYADDSGVILHSPDWHAGVVGIVASRIARKFNRPALVLGSDSEGLIKGSGRSIEGVNLVEVLQACSEHILQWGGHPMAVGLTIEAASIDPLRESFNRALRAHFPDGLPEPCLQIDACVQPADLTDGLLEELEAVSPFGQGNPEPVFALEQIHLNHLSSLGRDHLRFQISQPGSLVPIDGVAWNMVDSPPPLDRPVDLAVRYHWNSWRGNRSKRLTLVDWKLS